MLAYYAEMIIYGIVGSPANVLVAVTQSVQKRLWKVTLPHFALGCWTLCAGLVLFFFYFFTQMQAGNQFLFSESQ